jgi:hypothetical protein
MRYTLFIALALTLTLFIGCKGQENPHGTVPFEGTVTLDDKPIEGVSVTLNPKDGTNAAGGITGANGKFTVNTSGYSGAKPGTYDVTFKKVEIPGQDLSFEESQAKYGGKTPSPIYHIPQKYESVKTSGMEPITVTTDKKQNVFTFELKSQ